MKSKFVIEQLNEKSMKTKITIYVIIYLINKFVKFNNIIIYKLIIINKYNFKIFN